MRTDHDGDAHLDKYSNDMTVEGIEDVTVPAGTFKAFKIKQYQRNLSCEKYPRARSGWFGTAYYWYSPDAKKIIKRTDANNTVSWELVSYELK
ncbi:MAG: hypothetical protein LLG06_03650 [Desulfobacteraceae bacterium]|nr:hypothetical protein [Desulfobacteraceae bacterium]